MSLVKHLTRALAATAFAAVAASSALGTQPVTIAPVICAKQAQRVQATIELECGGMAGADFGGDIRLTKPTTGLPAPKWGKPGTTGVQVDTNLTKQDLIDFIKQENVPLVDPTTTKSTTDFQNYGVYQIFVPDNPDTGELAFKFGITSVGPQRPISQLPDCKKLFGANCIWRWVREDVEGWYKARLWEGHHAARYKSSHNGNCPPGMTSCK